MFIVIAYFREVNLLNNQIIKHDIKKEIQDLL